MLRKKNIFKIKHLVTQKKSVKESLEMLKKIKYF